MSAGAQGRSAGMAGHTAWIISAFALALQWLLIRWSGVHLPPPLEALSSGAGIFGAAFILILGRRAGPARHESGEPTGDLRPAEAPDRGGGPGRGRATGPEPQPCERAVSFSEEVWR